MSSEVVVVDRFSRTAGGPSKGAIMALLLKHDRAEPAGVPTRRAVVPLLYPNNIVLGQFPPRLANLSANCEAVVEAMVRI